MGCGGSKLDDLEAVALCRDRSRLLADAIRLRYALADSHAAYARSLRSAGVSLHRFLDALRSLPPPPPAPLLPLPPHRKGDPLPPSPLPSVAPAGAPAVASAHHSHSGSHIQFSDDSDDEEDDDEDDDISHLHSTASTPVRHPHAQPYVTYNYARTGPAPAAVSFERPPQQSPDTRSYYGYPSPAQTSGYYPYNYTGYQPDYSGYPPQNYAGGYGGIGGFFGGASSSSSPPPPPSMSMYGAAGGASPPTSRTPPPPPSPPKNSGWDFLNPFGSYETYAEEVRYPYTPSRSSREVREEEGIPDLEDEVNEVVKEAYGDRRENKAAASTSAASAGARAGEYAAKSVGKAKGAGEAGDDLHYETSNSSGEASSSSSSAESEVHVVDKDVVADEVKRSEAQPQQQTVAVVTAPSRYNDLSEVVQEIKTQFDRASGSFDEVSKMLEVGKIPYHQKNPVYEVSTMFICGPSSSTSKDEFLEFQEEAVMGSGNLSSTLRKLYMWEQKLFNEVKVEEKMRVVLERECEHLRRLDERGAETHKLESAQMLIRKLSTKIRIAIQVVESISSKISKLRDEELWPQISELIQGMMRMWKVMLECHRIQCQAISDATIASGGRLIDTHMEATKHLEFELLDLITCFSTWVSAQKSFVKALNGWLLKGLHYVPEETSDGIVPFSPGRLGAPPVFVVCNYWSQTIDRISEKEVVAAMKALAENVLGLWEQHNLEQRQRLMANRDMDKTLRVIETEEQQMRRAVEAQNKKLVLVTGESGLSLSGQVHHGHAADLSSMQLNLRQIFEAMENYTATSLKAYEELHLRSEEEKLARENSKVS